MPAPTSQESALEALERQNEDLVRAMVAAWCRKDVDAIVSCLAEDVVYMVYEGGRVLTGREAVRTTLTAFMKRWARINFDIQRLFVIGPLVIHERIEDYTGRDGQPDWHFEVANVHHIREGKITLWRDYALPGRPQRAPQGEQPIVL